VAAAAVVSSSGAAEGVATGKVWKQRGREENKPVEHCNSDSTLSVQSEEGGS